MAFLFENTWLPAAYCQLNQNSTIFISSFTYLYSMTNLPPCPKCKCEHTYSDNNLVVCPECFYEWNPADVIEQTEEEITTKVLDAHGNELKNGDSVIVIKDLPVKGASKSVKAGTKVKNIRLTDGDHNIDCKIDGFGSMGLKSQFVKKA